MNICETNFNNDEKKVDDPIEIDTSTIMPKIFLNYKKKILTGKLYISERFSVVYISNKELNLSHF